MYDSWNLVKKLRFHDKLNSDNEFKTLDLTNYKIYKFSILLVKYLEMGQEAQSDCLH